MVCARVRSINHSFISFLRAAGRARAAPQRQLSVAPGDQTASLTVATAPCNNHRRVRRGSCSERRRVSVRLEGPRRRGGRASLFTLVWAGGLRPCALAQTPLLSERFPGARVNPPCGAPSCPPPSHVSSQEPRTCRRVQRRLSPATPPFLQARGAEGLPWAGRPPSVPRPTPWLPLRRTRAGACDGGSAALGLGLD